MYMIEIVLPGQIMSQRHLIQGKKKCWVVRFQLIDCN
jgi:hypothetical protein